MKIFQPAAERSTAANLARMFAQTTVFWLVFIVVVPWLLHAGERALEIPSFAFPYQRVVAAILFVPLAAVNLGAGVTMAVVGRGTPFPTDTARELVIRGPYRWVRNPMGVGGIGAGVMVGVWFGSWPIVAYALAGAVVWHLVARPMEERDLAARFGEPYLRYCAHVRTWLPRIRPYRP